MKKYFTDHAGATLINEAVYPNNTMLFIWDDVWQPNSDIEVEVLDESKLEQIYEGDRNVYSVAKTNAKVV